MAHIGCDTGEAVQGTTFLYHIVPRKRVREEENLGPSRGRELTVFHKCAGPIPILGNKWRKRSDTNGKKASRKGRDNKENAHNNLKEEGLLPHKSSPSQRKSYAFCQTKRSHSQWQKPQKNKSKYKCTPVGQK